MLVDALCFLTVLSDECLSRPIVTCPRPTDRALIVTDRVLAVGLVRDDADRVRTVGAVLALERRDEDRAVVRAALAACEVVALGLASGRAVSTF